MQLNIGVPNLIAFYFVPICQKFLYLLGDVLHHLELSAGGVDFVHGAWLQFVDELAEDGPVLKDILEGLTGGELGAQDGLNPALAFLLTFGVTLGSELIEKTDNKCVVPYFADGTRMIKINNNVVVQKKSEVFHKFTKNKCDNNVISVFLMNTKYGRDLQIEVPQSLTFLLYTTLQKNGFLSAFKIFGVYMRGLD